MYHQRSLLNSSTTCSKRHATLPPPHPPIQIQPLPTLAPPPIAPDAEPQRTQRTDRGRLVQPQSAPRKIVHQQRRRMIEPHMHIYQPHQPPDPHRQPALHALPSAQEARQQRLRRNASSLQDEEAEEPEKGPRRAQLRVASAGVQEAGEGKRGRGPEELRGPRAGVQAREGD